MQERKVLQEAQQSELLKARELLFYDETVFTLHEQQRYGECCTQDWQTQVTRHACVATLGAANDDNS